MLDASITINADIKPLFEKLLKILDEIFDVYRRILFILDPEKEEIEKAVRYHILFETSPFKTPFYQRKGTQDSYVSSLINGFNAQIKEIENRAMVPLKSSRTATKLK